MLVFCLSAFAIEASATATILIDPGVGFNDATVPKVGQKGNNPGNTLGELRTNLFQEAANVWGAILNSTVPITIKAKFEPFGLDECVSASIQLGHAGPTNIYSNFGSGDANIAYPVSLAESLSATNLNGGTAEIDAAFNSRVDTDPDCLGKGGFYYGLDDNAPDGTTALFATVLHEMGHGLGFLSYVNPDGSLPTGNIDTFSRLLMDLQTGMNWSGMTNLERSNSMLNEPSLVWTGAKVTADRAMHLNPEAEVRINSPAPIANTFEAAFGEQSAAVPVGGVTAGVIDGDAAQADVCQQDFDSSFAGKIILYDSAACTASTLAVFSEFWNAAGVIVAATSGIGLPDMTGLIGNVIAIPYIGVSKSVADDLRANLGAVNVTILNSAIKLIGENQGKLKMYAPSAFQQGSSVSHWSKTASPDLLMEPTLGDLTYQNVDLTAAAFRDIGWSVNIPGGVVEVIYRDGFE